MSAFFPVAEFAEDQPLARTILTTHVIHRGFQTGAFAGAITGSSIALMSRLSKPATLFGLHGTNTTTQSNWVNGLLSRPKAVYISQRPYSSSTTATRGVNNLHFPATTPKTILPRVVKFTGVGGMLGAGAMALMVPYYMHGRDYIEWQDRSWRLLNNEGQVAVDNWSISGALSGIVSPVMVARLRVSSPWALTMIVGRAGIGSLAGTVGSYLV